MGTRGHDEHGEHVNGAIAEPLSYIHPELRHLVAALELGWTHVAVLPCDDDAMTATRYAIADNRTAELATWDEEALGEMLGLMQAEGVDLAALGFDAVDLLQLLGEEDEVVPELEEPDAELVEATCIQLGDLVVIGEHRLVCGDSTDPAVVAQVMLPSEQADLVWTDPPYGVAYVGKSEQLADARKTIANDDLGLEGTRDLVRRAAEAWPLRAGGVFYVCSPSGDMETAFRFGLVDARRRLRQAIAWVKNAFVLSHFDYHYQHETILYGWADGAGHYWCGSRSEASVWQVNKPTRADLHPTMKPVELVARGLKNSSRKGDVVFDGFGGAGSTLIAAAQMGRRARLVELSPGFCDVIVRRAVALGLSAMVHRPGSEPFAWEDPR